MICLADGNHHEDMFWSRAHQHGCAAVFPTARHISSSSVYYTLGYYKYYLHIPITGNTIWLLHDATC